MKSSSNSKIVKVITISAIIFITILCVVIGVTKKNGSTECAKGNAVTTAVTTVSDDGSLVTSSSSTTMKETTTSYVTTSITTNSAVTTSTTAVASTVADSKEEVPTTNIPTVRDEATPTPVPKPEPLPEPCDSNVEEPTPAPIVEEYLVYKPSTHYIHKNTCHWNCDDAYRIDNADGLEARLCTECGVQCEGYIPYVEPTPAPICSSRPDISDWDFECLCKITANEYGNATVTWAGYEISDYERGKIAASVMNQLRYGLSDTIAGCLDYSCAPWGFWNWRYRTEFNGVYYDDPVVVRAVNYYLDHADTDYAYWDCDSWTGCHPDGLNWFRKA